MRKLLALGWIAVIALTICGCVEDTAPKPTPTPNKETIDHATKEMKDRMDATAEAGGKAVTPAEPTKPADDAAKNDAEAPK